MKSIKEFLQDRTDERKARAYHLYHHANAIVEAQEVHDALEGETKIDEFEYGAFHVITAAGPGRIAWETYFDYMRARGLDPWAYNGYKRFVKDLRRD